MFAADMPSLEGLRHATLAKPEVILRPVLNPRRADRTARKTHHYDPDLRTPAMSKLTRRRFVQLAAAGLGATAASGFMPTFVIAGTKSSRRVLGANDTIRVAVAGIHGRGASHHPVGQIPCLFS